MGKSLLVLLGVAILSQNAWSKEMQIKRLPAAYLQLACGGSVNCATLPQRAPASENFQPAGSIPLKDKAEIKSTTLPVHEHRGGQIDFSTVGVAVNF